MKKKSYLFTAIIVLMAIGANAQTRQAFDPEQHVQNLMTAVKGQMTLSPEKQLQIEKLYLEFYADLGKMREESQGNFDRQKFMDRREKLTASLLTVLTQEEHDKLVEVERSLRRSRRPGTNQ